MQKVQYFYDKEADVFYFSQGKPNANDETIEAGNDVLIRRDPQTKKVRGFTLLNASRQKTARGLSVMLPFSLVLNTR